MFLQHKITDYPFLLSVISISIIVLNQFTNTTNHNRRYRQLNYFLILCNNKGEYLTTEVYLQINNFLILCGTRAWARYLTTISEKQNTQVPDRWVGSKGMEIGNIWDRDETQRDESGTHINVYHFSSHELVDDRTWRICGWNAFIDGSYVNATQRYFAFALILLVTV